MPSYLPCPYCTPEELSQALWLLSRPEGVQLAGDTDALFPTVDTLDRSGWLLVDGEEMINIHEGALPGGRLPQRLREILAKYVIAGALPESAEDDLRAKVAAQIGTRVPAAFLLPEELLPALRDLPQMVEAGVLNEPGGCHECR